MKIEAVRDDGALLVTAGGPGAAIVSADGAVWGTSVGSALARGEWDEPGSESVVPQRVRGYVAEVIEQMNRELGPSLLFTPLEAGLNTNLTAAAEVHTGAMIALVPTEEDARRIAVDGGEDVEQLHLTICYLGEAALIPPEVREQLVDCVSECAARLPTIAGTAFSVAVFNPVVAAALGAKEPCVVLGVSGSLLERAHDMIAEDAYDTLDLAGVAYPTPHSPWIPHVTLVYTDDADVAAFAEKTGPLSFDRVRLAFGGETYDVPLGDHTVAHDGMLPSSPGEESEYGD